jgi:3-oxoacyl-[acyl-carrier protein] reductase
MPIADLSGRVALVTGVSRRIGIAATIAERLLDAGAIVVATGWPPHDEEMPWGKGENAPPQLHVEQHDLSDAAVPALLVDAVVDRHGRLDIVVAVHARSSDYSLPEVTADELDRCWAVNVRSIVLLAQRFAARHDATETGGRMIWFTSGQHQGPMPSEIPYAVTKGALHQMTATLAEALSDAGIVANCINPGPVDTGWATGDTHEAIARRFPSGRWGQPSDVANLVEFLVSDRGGWIQGQVIDSEGGFRR